MSRPPSQPASRRERRAQARAERPVPQRKKIVRRQTAARPAWQSPLALTTIGALVIGLVVIVAATGLKFGGSDAFKQPATSYAGITVDGATVGSPNAPVVMQVYGDFQCTACGVFYTTQLPQLLRDLVQPGLLRIESTDIDIIDRGNTESLELAAGAYCAAQQNKYWQYHDLVYWNQGGENVGYYSAAFIDRVATDAGLDLAAFHACQARSDIRQPIIDATNTARAAGITATPTLVIGGQAIPGVPNYDQLRSYILQLASQASPSAAPSASPEVSPVASPEPSGLPSPS